MLPDERSEKMICHLKIIAARNNDQYDICKQEKIDPEAVLEIKIEQTASRGSQKFSNQCIDHGTHPYAWGDRDSGHPMRQYYLVVYSLGAPAATSQALLFFR